MEFEQALFLLDDIREGALEVTAEGRNLRGGVVAIRAGHRARNIADKATQRVDRRHDVLRAPAPALQGGRNIYSNLLQALEDVGAAVDIPARPAVHVHPGRLALTSAGGGCLTQQKRIMPVVATSAP